ncbi:hypothetical protein D6D54_07710 [Spiroplasma poulsonii]|uniref:Uncharacterized protein n=1 Tax=Spiroplasma poulsonii TaxID=2138 RepID=A0A3S0ULT6_9MOLU|nr:hypothetical protein [Spiroplasma poulsonii]MBW3059309.1 hypothetical protein [Spiroplasma poulsonii]RUP75715.1 hypothetical protein D6D54_07710 [Spiroplasma poulsonii]
MPNIDKQKTNITKNLINKTSSFSDVKEFKKLDNSTFMPRMKCNARVVMAFRNEAKIKKWQLTTLMNEILAERYSIDLENNNYEDD